MLFWVIAAILTLGASLAVLLPLAAARRARRPAAITILKSIATSWPSLTATPRAA